MSKIYVKSKMSYCEPMEALVAFYKDGSSLQEMVNAFINAGEERYNRLRIKNLLRTYRRLVDSGEYERPADIELDEEDRKYATAVREDTLVYVKGSMTYKNVMAAIIYWYEHGSSISSMQESIANAGIESYSRTRIQNLIKTYKTLKQKGLYQRPIDVELAEPSSKGEPAKNTAVKVSKTAKKKTSKPVVNKTVKKIKFNDKTGEFEMR